MKGYPAVQSAMLTNQPEFVVSVCDYKRNDADENSSDNAHVLEERPAETFKNGEVKGIVNTMQHLSLVAGTVAKMHLVHRQLCTLRVLIAKEKIIAARYYNFAASPVFAV